MTLSYFEKIEEQITSSISEAKDRVYVAVAWFSNHVIFDELIRALKREVRVKILILDDLLNRNEFGLNFGIIENNGADVRFANSKSRIMHNKFCVIDDKVITGSYNWTYHANKNRENIIIVDEPGVAYSLRLYREKP